MPSRTNTTAKRVLTIDLDVRGDASLERYTAEARKGLLEDALGLTIELRPAVDAA